ncbi:MAG: hypothetical protein EOO01_08695 [Chitinophagaceae bacterium]|nr:MAG: hypothetical protein EOO01_08695 [Chitinophagaceae bacterium]
MKQSNCEGQQSGNKKEKAAEQQDWNNPSHTTFPNFSVSRNESSGAVTLSATFEFRATMSPNPCPGAEPLDHPYRKPRILRLTPSGEIVSNHELTE